MGSDTISTPDLSTPQPLKNKLQKTIPTIKLIFFPLIIIVLLILYFIFYPKTFLYPLSRQNLGKNNFASATIAPSPTSIPTVSLGLVGDLGLGRFITSTARQKNDFSWSFQGISPWLMSHDFNLANLESPIIKDCPEGKTGTFTFCGDSRFLPYLKANKLVLNLANNHILNYGLDGLSQTHNYLSENDIVYFPEFATKTVNGISFGFLGYDFITDPAIASEAKQSKIINDVKKYNSTVDWLIVSIHWGN
ncbi:MAG TPA: CapA family protein, partial [Candidatus Methanoperedens sp.]|nr:CapA family protein [Candidatus Methanoperedens sp.]